MINPHETEAFDFLYNIRYKKNEKDIFENTDIVLNENRSSCFVVASFGMDITRE